MSLKQTVERWLFPRLLLTRALFDQLRFEASAARVWLGYAAVS